MRRVPAAFRAGASPNPGDPQTQRRLLLKTRSHRAGRRRLSGQRAKRLCLRRQRGLQGSCGVRGAGDAPAAAILQVWLATCPGQAERSGWAGHVRGTGMRSAAGSKADLKSALTLHKSGPLEVPCFWWVESTFKSSLAEGCVLWV